MIKEYNSGKETFANLLHQANIVVHRDSAIQEKEAEVAPKKADQKPFELVFDGKTLTIQPSIKEFTERGVHLVFLGEWRVPSTGKPKIHVKMDADWRIPAGGKKKRGGKK